MCAQYVGSRVFSPFLHSAGLSLGGMCIVMSVLLFLDFIVSVRVRKRFKREAY